MRGFRRTRSKDRTPKPHLYMVRVEIFTPDGHLIVGSTTEGKLHAPNLRNGDEMVQQAMDQASVDHKELA